MDRELIRLEAKKELARRSFWDYCKLKAPDFYQEERTYLKNLCNELQEFYEDPEQRILVINMPPRHGKSRTAGLFVQWVLGRSIKNKIMTGSYNETLSGTFAKSVRDVIAEQPTEGTIVYNDIFPNTRIKYGEAAASKWALEGSGVANYLATSPSGTATGFGCNIMILDDVIKNAIEAFNEATLQKHIEWFNNTMLSRTENGFKLIAIMTRWATNDLAGYILREFDNVRHITYKAMLESGAMLCEDVLSKEDFKLKTKHMDKAIVEANYQQKPIDIQGRLYSNIKTYSSIPTDESGKPLFQYYLNYTDTADTGADYLCSICYGVYNDEAYILDIVYSKEPMEKTEPLVAAMLTKNNIGIATIESNNGGRGFARNIETIIRQGGNRHTVIKTFHQTQNKVSRILSNSTGVMNNIYFPVNWQDKWGEFATAILSYQREGKNAHDDAPDALTGVYENMKPMSGWF